MLFGDILFHVWSNCSWRTFGKLSFTIWYQDNFLGVSQFCHFGQPNTTRGQQNIGGHLPFITQSQNWVGKPFEGFAVQRQEGERKFAIILAFTQSHSRNGFGESCPFLWARVSPTKLPWRSSHRAALLSPEPWRVIPFSLPFLSFQKVGGNSKGFAMRARRQPRQP